MPHAHHAHLAIGVVHLVDDALVPDTDAPNVLCSLDLAAAVGSWIVREALDSRDDTLEDLAPQPAQVALHAALEENVMHSGAAFPGSLPVW